MEFLRIFNRKRTESSGRRLNEHSINARNMIPMKYTKSISKQTSKSALIANSFRRLPASQ